MRSRTSRSATVARILRNRQSLLAAAIAVPLMAAASARAQFPAGNDGHALDANNRVGSGGYNGATHVGPSVTQNNIVYGNVTGLGAFQGPLTTFDSTQFRGNLAGGSVDRFVAESNGAAARATPSAVNFNQSPTAFFGNSRFVAAPNGTVQSTSNIGAVPVTSSQAGSYLGSTTGSYANGGNINYYGTLNETPVNLNGQYAPYSLQELRIGPPDNGQQTILSVSPLSGIQQLPLNGATENYYLGQLLQQRGTDRFRPIDADTIKQMQDDLRQSALTGTNPLNQPGTLKNSAGEPPKAGQDQLNVPAGQPLDSPVNSPLNGAPLKNAISGQPLNSSLNSNALPNALEQSPLMKELNDRFNQHQVAQSSRSAMGTVLTGGKAQPAKGPQVQLPGAPPVPGVAQPGVVVQNPLPGATGSAPNGPQFPGLTPSTPSHSTAPHIGGAPSVPGPGMPGLSSGLGTSITRADIGSMAALNLRTNKDLPLKIESLAAGIRAKGLANLLKSAEDLMQQGKFASAQDQYATAVRVAPNNPLITVGMANSELGAMNYRDAEMHLRDAFGASGALLHAQFDLTTYLGASRLKVITEDLVDLAKREPQSEMPEFLLAYINYNTSHESQAMQNLQQVETRSGHADPLVQQMREHWYVPSGPAPTPLNK